MWPASSACEAVITCHSSLPRARRDVPEGNGLPGPPFTPHLETVNQGVSTPSNRPLVARPPGFLSPVRWVPTDDRAKWCWARSVSLSPIAILDGRTRLGARNRVYPFACLGIAPQDLKYKGKRQGWRGQRQYHSRCVTISGGRPRAASQESAITVLIMAYAHIGHDSLIGSHCI